MELWLIITISGVSVALLVAVYLALYFTFIRKRKLKKQMKALNSKYQTLAGLLAGQDTQYIKRLNQISMQNEAYVETYFKMFSKLKDLRERRDIQIAKQIDSLFDMFDKSIFKDVKEQYIRVKDNFSFYERDVNRLDTELKQIFEVEEKLKIKVNENLEQVNRIKQEYYSAQNDLKIVAGSIDAIFASLDREFARFDALIIKADYEKVEEILPNVMKIANELKESLKNLPSICVMAEKTVPANIEKLKDKYFDMVKQGYPLQHLIKDDSITNLQSNLETIVDEIKGFKITKAMSKLNSINQEIDRYMKGFEKEIENKKIYDKECDTIYKKENVLEKEFVKLNSGMPKIMKNYKISEEYTRKKEEIKNGIDKVAYTKRGFDTFRHSNTKPPYSILVEKMNELNSISTSIEEKINDFNKYLLSLKTKSQEAYKLLNPYYLKLRAAEHLLEEINLKCIEDQFKSELDKIYTEIDEINKTLYQLPINVEIVDKYVNDLKGHGEEILNKLKQVYDYMKRSEMAIVRANRNRHNLSDVNALIVQSENLFFNGKFEKAYNDTVTHLRRQDDEVTTKKRK